MENRLYAKDIEFLWESVNRLLAKSSLSMLDEENKQIHDTIFRFLDSYQQEKEVCDFLTYARQHPDLICKLRELNAIMHQTTENELAKKYLSSDSQKDPFVSSWINKGFKEVLSQQINEWKSSGLSFNRESPLVIVGGGALPQTQIYLHKELDMEIISLERDPLSAQLCTELLRKFGLGHLKVLNVDGKDYNYADTYLTIVATLVPNKFEIAKRITETSKKTFLAPRTPIKLHQLWREPLIVSEIEKIGWRLINRCHPTGSSIASLTFGFSSQ